MKYFLAAPDQMQTLHIPGEVLPLLCHRGMCHWVQHRVRFFRVLTAHPRLKMHTEPPPPRLGSNAKAQRISGVLLSSGISL